MLPKHIPCAGGRDSRCVLTHLYGGASVALPTACGLACHLQSGCERLVLPQPERNPLSSELLVSRLKPALAGDVKMEMPYHPRWIRKWEEREAHGSGHGTLPLSESCPPGTHSTAMAMNEILLRDSPSRK